MSASKELLRLLEIRGERCRVQTFESGEGRTLLLDSHFGGAVGVTRVSYGKAGEDPRRLYHEASTAEELRAAFRWLDMGEQS